MPESSPELRTLYARLGAYESWARTEDRTARTANGRKAFLDKFERQVDPECKLTPSERARRAEFARKAFYTRLAMRSAEVRQARAAQRPPRPTPEQKIAELERLAAGGDRAS
jgi:hypothetical protein